MQYTVYYGEAATQNYFAHEYKHMCTVLNLILKTNKKERQTERQRERERERERQRERERESCTKGRQ